MSSWPWVTVRWWGSFRSISIVSLVSQTWAAVLIARPPLPPPGLSPSFSLTPFPPPPLAGPTTGEAACDLARGGCSGLLSRARILANSVAGLADSHSFLGCLLLASPALLLEPGCGRSVGCRWPGFDVGSWGFRSRPVCLLLPDYRPVSSIWSSRCLLP